MWPCDQGCAPLTVLAVCASDYLAPPSMVKRLNDQVKTHERALSHNILNQCDASLMELFYTDPSRLAQAVEGSIARAR